MTRRQSALRSGSSATFYIYNGDDSGFVCERG
jgi:hypothetical protein